MRRGTQKQALIYNRNASGTHNVPGIMGNGPEETS